MTHFRTLFIAATLALSTVAFAAHPTQVKLLEKFDTNKNGRIDPEEWEARRAARKAEMLNKYDTNRNGQLEPTEKDAAKKAHSAERLAHAKQRFAEMDVNKDGKLVSGEVQGRLSRRFAKIDANKDGALTWAEVEAGHARKGGRGHGHDCRDKG